MKRKIKIALISSFTSDLLVPLITKELLELKIYCDWYIAPFNQIAQEVKLKNSPVKKFNPEIVLLLLSQEDFLKNIGITLSLIREYSVNFPKANVLITNAYLLYPQQLIFFKSNSPEEAYYRVNKINIGLVELIKKLKNVQILDFSNLITEFGRQVIYDARFHYLAKIPFSKTGLDEIASLIGRSIFALVGNRKKCLVLDLDNVLWGGILSEDGEEHLKLDISGEGRAFYDFQNAILELYQSGIILAICSKNDEKTALNAIKRLPYMVLREDKFASIRINWLSKAENIISIAKELNLGLDSFVFLDDTPFEREAVRKLVPEVVVPEMPNDFSLYTSFLAKLPFFDTFTFTKEDASRGELYVQERKRAEMKEKATSIDDFLKSLHIKVYIKKADEWVIPRVSQLTQKTNQFNLSANGYKEVEITEMIKDTETQVLYVRAKDDLGDAGIVGVAILKQKPHEVFLDTFLVSCRVLNRGIEETFISEIARLSKKAGAKKIKARYNRTRKNTMVEGFLHKVGFKRNEGYYWLNLNVVPKGPSWITIDNL